MTLVILMKNSNSRRTAGSRAWRTHGINHRRELEGDAALLHVTKKPMEKRLAG